MSESMTEVMKVHGKPNPIKEIDKYFDDIKLKGLAKTAGEISETTKGDSVTFVLLDHPEDRDLSALDYQKTL